MTLDSIHFDSLERVSEETLYRVFLDAFFDYAVPITATMDDFLAMHVRRGVSYVSSVGAFDGDRLAGFIFNGEGIWNGGRCAYDAGTGVIPAYRGIGLSKALAEETGRLLRASGFSHWLLEVLIDNDKAIRTYKGAGFFTTRRFSCPDGMVADPTGAAEAAMYRAGVKIDALDTLDIRRFSAWRAWEPSWQNSDASVARSPERLFTLGAFPAGGRNGEPVGYIVATEKGSVLQLAVHPDHRRSGIGKSLVAALASRTPEGKVRYVNVQSDDEATLGLLATFGIQGGPAQWEMLRNL